MIKKTEAGQPASVCCPIICLVSSSSGVVQLAIYQSIKLVCFFLIYGELILQNTQLTGQFFFVSLPAGKVFFNHCKLSFCFIDAVANIVEAVFNLVVFLLGGRSKILCKIGRAS